MPTLYQPGLGYEAGVPVAATDPTDAASPNKTALAPVVAVVSTSGASAPAGTQAEPSYSVDGATTKTDRSIATSTTSQTAAPANTARKRLLMQNQDAAINVFVNLGATATTGQGSIRIGPGSSLDLEGTTQALNIVAASGTPVVTIWEF